MRKRKKNHQALNDADAWEKQELDGKVIPRAELAGQRDVTELPNDSHPVELAGNDNTLKHSHAPTTSGKVPHRKISHTTTVNDRHIEEGRDGVYLIQLFSKFVKG